MSMQAARVRCTVGEISDALEKVHGRHVATIRTVSGAYASEYSDTEEIASARKKVEVSNIDRIEEQNTCLCKEHSM